MICKNKQYTVEAERVSDLIDFSREYEKLPAWIQQKYNREQIVFNTDFMVIDKTLLTRDYVAIHYPNGWVRFLNTASFKNEFITENI